MIKMPRSVQYSNINDAAYDVALARRMRALRVRRYLRMLREIHSAKTADKEKAAPDGNLEAAAR